MSCLVIIYHTPVVALPRSTHRSMQTQTHYKRLQGLAYKTPYSLIFFPPPFMLNQGKTISFTPVHGHVHRKNSATCQKYLAPCSMKIHFKKNNDLFFSILWCVAAHFISSDVWLPFIYCLKNKQKINYKWFWREIPLVNSYLKNCIIPCFVYLHQQCTFLWWMQV